MRLPRVRFTIRRMMLVILVVAIAVGGLIETGRYRIRLRRRSSEYSRIASSHSGKRLHYERQAKEAEDMAISFHYMAKVAPESAAESHRVERENLEQAALLSRLAQKERGLMNKWRRAQQLPWLPVAPDPPAPE
jgi:hypothetical protein